MKKIILKKGHLNQLVEKMIKENTQTEGYDSPDRKDKFKIDIIDVMHKGFEETINGLGMMAEQIGKLEIEKPTHDDLKKRLLQTIVEEQDELITRTVEEYEKESKTTSSSNSHEKAPCNSE